MAQGTTEGEREKTSQGRPERAVKRTTTDRNAKKITTRELNQVRDRDECKARPCTRTGEPRVKNFHKNKPAIKKKGKLPKKLRRVGGGDNNLVGGVGGIKEKKNTNKEKEKKTTKKGEKWGKPKSPITDSLQGAESSQQHADEKRGGTSTPSSKVNRRLRRRKSRAKSSGLTEGLFSSAGEGTAGRGRKRPSKENAS